MKDGCSGALQKIVTLPFEGVEYNTSMKSSKFTFRGKLCLKVGEVFNVFKNKTYEVGDLEYFAQGITNWNCHKWGIGMRINTLTT